MVAPRTSALVAALLCAPAASLVVLLAPGCTTPGGSGLRGPPIGGEARELAVLYTGDSWGELEPCG